MSSYHNEFESARWARARRRFLQASAAGGALLFAPGRPFAQAGQPTGLEGLEANDPALHRISQDVLHSTKYTLTAAAAGHPGTGHPLAQEMRDYIATRKPASAEAYRSAARALLASPEATKEAFGRYAVIRPEEFLAMDRAGHLARVGGPVVAKGSLRLATLMQTPKSGLADVHVADQLSFDPHAAEEQALAKMAAEQAAKAHADLEAGVKLKTLIFQVNRISCRRTTSDPYFSGGDHIAIGGLAIGATGNHHKVPEQIVFPIHNIAGASDSASFYPGTRADIADAGVFKRVHFAEFAVDLATDFPHGYGVSIGMGALGDDEKSGFVTFLDKVWDHVKGMVLSAIGDAIVDAVAITALSAIPFIGTIIGAIVGAVINWLTGLCHHSNPDKVLGSHYVACHLHSATLSGYGDLAKGGWPGQLQYTRDGSDYSLDYAWRLLKPGEVSIEGIGII